MADNLSPEKRSRVMSAIRSKNTGPELAVRRIVWSMGVRYRIHDRSVFGTPDISNKSRGVAVFIDGCFWHGCGRCYREPRTNTGFWRDKIANNKRRRRRVASRLRSEGWSVLQFWEHSVNGNPRAVAERVRMAMRPSSKKPLSKRSTLTKTTT